MKPLTRITILGGDKIFRDEVKSFLMSTENVEITGAYPIAWDPIKIIEQHHPDLVLMLIPAKITSDLRVLLLRIVNTYSLNILVLLNRIPPPELLQLILCGVNGFVSMHHWKEQLMETINVVSRNGIAISPFLTKKVIEFLRNPVLEEKSKKLTTKEFQVLSEIRRGSSYRELADFFNIGESTIRTHCKSIYRKLGVRGRIEAINMVFLNPGVVQSRQLNSTG